MLVVYLCVPNPCGVMSAAMHQKIMDLLLLTLDSDNRGLTFGPGTTP